MFFRLLRQIAASLWRHRAVTAKGRESGRARPYPSQTAAFHPIESHSIVRLLPTHRLKRLSNHLEQIILGEGLFQHHIPKIEAARSYVFTGVARHENSFKARPECAQ